MSNFFSKYLCHVHTECQHTSTKERAGQSASDNDNFPMIVLLLWLLSPPYWASSPAGQWSMVIHFHHRHRAIKTIFHGRPTTPFSDISTTFWGLLEYLLLLPCMLIINMSCCAYFCLCMFLKPIKA